MEFLNVVKEDEHLLEATLSEPIAIIGMSCRYPQAESLADFLRLLQEGKSGLSDIPNERWDNEQYFDENLNALGKLYIRQLGLLDNIKYFDADFFNVSPREAKLMAPQLRLFMEGSYHALEHANLALDKIKGSKTGVFVGIGDNEYPDMMKEGGINPDNLNIYYASGNAFSAVAGRVAYSFDFQGPIQAIDTACSSSMTAIHNACLSLQVGDCDLALAGGINVLLSPDTNVALCKAKMLSPQSRCKTFSDDADGYARSEGYGIVVLKRLSTALRAKDNILALIKGSAINSDGKSGGFTVPNGLMQEKLIRSALAKAELSPRDIDYIEAHGTGTPLADPIEVNTLMSIFADSHSGSHPLYLGSVKTNIGHTESASGVAGLIKGVLSLQEQQFFKHLNFKNLNPGIELKNTVIPLKNLPWQRSHGLRAFGVSSFGFSGANAHLVVQEMPQVLSAKRILPKESILVLSAKTKESLELLLISYHQYLLSTHEEWADICFTTANCRSHFLFRASLIAHSKKEAAQNIKEKKYELAVLKKEQGAASDYHELPAVQAAYQQGFKINWDTYFEQFNSNFLKANLPLYPFVKKEYWYEESDKIKDTQLPKDWSFQLQWQEQNLNQNNNKVFEKNWLLLGNLALADELTKQGLSITLEPEHYVSRLLDGIIFDLSISNSTSLDELLEEQKDKLKLLLSWVKKLQFNEINLRLVMLTSQAVAELANEQDKLSQDQAGLSGLCKTLILELPQFQTLLLDFAGDSSVYKAKTLIKELECNHGNFYEHHVAFRDHKRFVSRLKKSSLKESKPQLNSRGRYLVTGGTGGLGIVSAQALLSAGAKEIVLVARHIDKPEFQEQLKQLDLAYPGRAIRCLALDLIDKDSLADLIEKLSADGQLKGIIHAAGAGIKAPLLEHQEEDVDYTFAAKVQGAWYLHELSKNLNLDFFFLYSSISSVFGSNKESVYSAANSCMDLLIAERRTLGLVGSTIQWGPWGDAGMSQKRSRDEQVKKSLISNEQGHHFIKVLLSGRPAELVIISPEYLHFMLDFVPQPQPLFYQHLQQELLYKEGVEESTASNWLHSYSALKPDDRLLASKEMVTNLCKEILDTPTFEELDEDQGFFELGFDSLMVAQLASELKRELEPALRVVVNIGFNYPTVNKLAAYIAEELNLNLVKSSVIPAQSHNEDIAIIGMSCSFPQASNVHAFERLLEEGRNAIQDIPKERWDNTLYYDPDMNVPGKSYVSKLGLMDHIKEFDASFFGISPREAKLMDPQQRLFLEACYTAMEQANYPIKTLNGTATGVFVGVGPNEFYMHLEKLGFSNEELDMYSLTGNVVNLIPGRVAYFFDLKGPSLAVDTACSSSLVAIHYACQSLRTREIDYAFAGGVNVLLWPEANITLSKARALSPEGQCKTFDAKADGYVRGEGCGVLLLKRFSDALRDKDTILAVIKASAVNNDGKSAGLTVPNGKSQEEVMRKALKLSQLASTDISYLEAHGTGTPLGDPIEVHAINQVYGSTPRQDNPLYLGAVKTNIGHLEGASGVAGVIKTILSLQNKKIYKHLNFSHLNSNIELKASVIPLQTMEWRQNAGLRAAGINAFGFSGTNAHLIMQEYVHPVLPRTNYSPSPYLLVLSARSKNSLEALVNLYQEYLAHTDEEFINICFTAASCRTHYPLRLAVAASTAKEAGEYLGKGLYALSFGEDNTNFNDPILRSLLSTYLKNKDPDWHAFYKNLKLKPKRVSLPTYPFDRQVFWPELQIQAGLLAPIVPIKSSVFTQPNTTSLLMALKNQGKEERVASLERVLAQLSAMILEMNPDQITPQVELFSLGLDSLMAVDLRSRIHDMLRCPALSISMEYFINKPSIANIAKVIAEELESVFNAGEEKRIFELANKEILVSDIQYPLWALEQYDLNFNLGLQFRLAGELNRDYFLQAFTVMVQNNTVFWLDFNKELPKQSLRKEGKLELEFRDFSETDNEAELNSWFYYHLITRIPLNKQPLLRLFLYKINTKLYEVHLIIPHIIAEGKSCDLMMAQFKENYELLVVKKPLTILSEENYYFSYVQSSNYHCLKNLPEKIKFWGEYNRGIKHLYLGSEYQLPDAAIEQEHYMLNYPLVNSIVEQFIVWHRSKNLNISSGLIALTHIALYALSGQNSLPLTLIHTGREGEKFQKTMGLFAEYKQINNIINDNNHFMDCIHFIEEQLLNTARFQKCPIMIKQKNIKGGRLALPAYIIYLWNKYKRGKAFATLGLHPYLHNLYLAYLSKISFSKFHNQVRVYLRRYLGIPILTPAPLRTLVNITPSFFVKKAASEYIGDLHLSYPNHFAFADIPVGNKALWVYFSRDQEGVYQLSLNGPLTKECQDEMARLINQLMERILEDETLLVRDLIEN